MENKSSFSNTLSYIVWSVLRYFSVDELPPHLQWQEDTEEVVFHRQDSWLNSAVHSSLKRSIILLSWSHHPKFSQMDLSNSSPVITDPVAISQQLLGGLPSNLMQFSVMPGGYSSSGMNVGVSRLKIEEVLVNGLLDAMKSSSPRRRLNVAFGEDNSSEEEDPAYSAWMVSYNGYIGCVSVGLISCTSNSQSFSFRGQYWHMWWLVLQAKCPSALASFKQIVASAQGKKIAVFLDYDGTLSPIVDDPDKAVMSPVVSLNINSDQ